MALSTIKSSFDSICRLSRFFGQNLLSAPVRSNLTSVISPCSSVASNYVPSRGKHFDHHFLNRWMARDYKRRVMLKERYPERLRMVAMKRCTVLPKEFQEMVAEEIQAFPRDSCHVRLSPRCILSSRPRWVIPKYRLGRIYYRLLADYNKLCGVNRSTW